MLNRWRMTARQPFGNTMPRVAGRWMNCVHGMRSCWICRQRGTMICSYWTTSPLSGSMADLALTFGWCRLASPCWRCV